MSNNSSKRLASLVEDKRRELMRSDLKLSAKDAFLRATELILKENPALLSAYRADTDRI